MRISIIIPAYNAASTLSACLSACLAQDYPDTEVLLVDDGSTDATPEIAQAFTEVIYLRQANAGPAAARNCGAAHATGEILVFTDSDCVPEANWIRALVTEFDENTAGVGGTYGIANPEFFLARLVHEEIQIRHAAFAPEVDFLGSFNVAYRAEVFRAVGGFDEAFPRASAEDNDLAYRIQDTGATLRFTPNAVVAHYHPTHLLPYLRTQMQHGFWRMKLYAKHPQRAQKGDQYAGPCDLLAPPYALFLLLLLPFVLPACLFNIWRTPILFGYDLLVLGYLLLHLPLVLQLWRRTHHLEAFYFLPIAALRDFARAIGLTYGVLYFFPKRRSASHAKP